MSSCNTENVDGDFKFSTPIKNRVTQEKREQDFPDSDRVSSIQRYKEFMGTAQISFQDYQQCLDGNNDLIRDKWRLVVKNTFSRVVQECPLNIKNSGKKINSKKSVSDENPRMVFVGYGYCVFPRCRSFRLEIMRRNEEVYLDVYASRPEFSHQGKMTTPLKSLEREIEKETLKDTKPSSYQRQCVIEANPDVVLSGNALKIRNDATARVVRREAMARDYLHPDPVFDAMLHLKEELLSGKSPASLLVQDIGFPLHAYLFSDLQIETVRKKFKDPKTCSVKFDASGKKVGALTYDPRNRVLLYSGVVNIDGNIFPLFEAISVRHSQFAIGSFLELFRGLCHQLHPNCWPLFGRMVIDCSYPLLHGSMRALNDMRLADYLRTLFNYLTGKYTAKDIRRIIIITLCRNHFIAMGTATIKDKFGKKSPARRFLSEALCAMLQAQDLSEFTEIYKGFLIVTLSKTITKEVTVAYQKILKVSSTVEIEVSENVEIEIDEFLFEPDIKLLDSPFYTFCFEIYISVKNEIRNEPGRTNENYCPDYVTDVFLKRYAPIIPLWTEVLKKDRGQDFLSSNSDVEEYYRILNEDILEHAPSVRIRKYIELVGGYILALVKKLNLCIETKPLTKSQKTLKGNERPHLTVVDAPATAGSAEDPNYDPDDPADDPNLEDAWNKRVKNPQSHLHLLHTRKLLEQSKSMSAGTDVQVNMAERKEHQVQVPDKDAWKGYLNEELVKTVHSLSARNEDVLLYVYGKDDHPLYFSSILSLLQNGRLDTSLVDTWVYILREKMQITDIFVSSTAMAGMVFNQDVRNFDQSCVNIGGARTLLFPVLRDSHWWLILCDLNGKTLTSFNAHETVEDQKLLENFLSFLDTWSPSTDAMGWKISEADHRRQGTDEVNCGVYMIWYLRNTVGGQSLTDHLNITEERCKIATECLDYSPNATFGELSFTSSNEMLLPNGLVNNIQYYNAEGSTEIDGTIMSVIAGLPPVRVEDFRRLIQNDWLTGPTINAIVFERCKNRDDVLFIPTLEAPKIFDRNSNLNKQSFLVTSILKDKKMVIPLHVNGNHWCLVVADMKTKKYTYLDPMHPTERNDLQMDNFLIFLRKRNSMTTDNVVTTRWSAECFLGIATQTDSNNCGVYVCAYAIAYLNNTLKNLTQIDCNGERVRYAEAILKSAPCCKHLCLSCGQDEFKKCRMKMVLQEMVQCNICQRWIHMWPCLRYLKLKPKQIRANDYTFHCRLCEKNGHLLGPLV